MSGLNREQNEAVVHTAGPLLVLAGPGSGKTRVLVNRIAHMVGPQGIFPSQILAVTFTNKAAQEMKKRVEQLIGVHARELSMGTFHSISLNILRKHALELGFPERFVVYDDSDQLALIKECANKLELDDKKFPPRTLLDKISRAKDQCQSPSAFAQKSSGNPYLAPPPG